MGIGSPAFSGPAGRWPLWPGPAQHLEGVPRACPSCNPLKVGWELPLAENFGVCLGGDLVSVKPQNEVPKIPGVKGEETECKVSGEREKAGWGRGRRGRPHPCVGT